MKMVFGSITDPIELAKALAIFPKSVHFARLAQTLKLHHLHSTFASYNATCAQIMAELSGLHYSVATHAYDILFEKPLLGQRLSKALFIITISEYNLSLIEHRYGEEIRSRTHLVRCGVDLAKYRPVRESVAARKDDVLNVLCVAALRPEKGHMFLLRAIDLLKREGRKISCVLVGDGPLQQEINDEITKLGMDHFIEMVGSQTQGDVLKWLAWSDCVVLSSLREGIPVSFMEAMACGLPVVTTDASPSIAELVEDGKSGIIVPRGDIDSFAKALSYIRDHPDIAYAYGQRGREIVEEKYNLKKNVGVLADYFLKAVTATMSS
jgi:glycosyltransferase involved in cell wall biosynthesis